MPPSALDALFETQGEPVALLGGGELFTIGQEATHLFKVTSGRLAVTEPVMRGGSRLVDVCRPGEVVGAGPLIIGASHATTATALRDTDVLRLTKGEIDAVGLHSDVYAALARTALEPGSSAAGASSPRRASILGFVAVCDSVPMLSVAQALARAMRDLGLKVVVLGSDGIDFSPATLSRLEDANDFLILAAEKADIDYTDYLGRQIDRLILVAGADSPMPQIPFAYAALAIHRHQLLDLVIMHPATCVRPHQTYR